MASIKDITLKSAKVIEGANGTIKQGNIYLNEKKVGFFSKDMKNEKTTISYKVKGAKEEILIKVEEYFKENFTMFDFEITEDFFFCELFDLIETEKEFKKAIKDGFDAILKADCQYDFILNKEKPVPQIFELSNSDIEKNKDKEIIEKLKTKGYDKFSIYKSFNDFFK